MTTRGRQKTLFKEKDLYLNRVSWLRKACRTFIITAMAGLAQFAYADSETATAWGPSIGTTAPLLSALDQDGKQQNMESLNRTNGLLLVFNRSVDW
jgi:hypothetical protein